MSDASSPERGDDGPASGFMSRFRLDGQVAVVTAAGRGIGAAIATAYAEAGADVVIGARTEADLVDVAEAIIERGQRVEVVAGDLSTREGMERLVSAAVDGLGGLSTVVNNAGGSPPSAFLDTSEASFDKSMQWNVTTAFNLTQLAVPHLLEGGGGSVVNIASSAGRYPSRGFVAYGTAKAALIELTRRMAQDLAPRIRVNCIAPGAIETSALASVLTDYRIREAMEQSTPMRRIGEPDDIAAGAVYLASRAASYVTGELLGIDGGITGSNFDMGLPDL